MPINNVRWEQTQAATPMLEPLGFSDSFSWELTAAGEPLAGSGTIAAPDLPGSALYSLEIQAQAINPTPVLLSIVVANANGVESTLKAELAPGGSYHLDTVPGAKANTVAGSSFIAGLYSIVSITVDSTSTKASYSVPNLEPYKFLVSGSQAYG
jgi:hypothetical protein